MIMEFFGVDIGSSVISFIGGFNQDTNIARKMLASDVNYKLTQCRFVDERDASYNS